MTDSTSPSEPVPGAAPAPGRGARSSARGWSTFLTIALALHLPLFVYPLLRLANWLDLAWWVTLILAVPVVGGQTISRIWLRNRRAGVARVLRLSADALLGISPVILGLLLCAEVFVSLGWVTAGTAARWVLGLGFLAAAAGTFTALNPQVVRVQLRSSKIEEALRFVQISDLHIGSRSREFLERVIAQVNAQAPDFLCITGDFIDATGVSEGELAALRSVNCPIYFSIGNHERYEDLDAILARLERLGVNVLRTRSMRQGSVQVIGVDDKDDADQVENELSKLEVEQDAFVVLMYHRPRGLEAAAAAGVDLMLSGHTHNGQIIPFNLIVGRVFEHVKGLVRHGATHLYVNQGTGTWGPVMRLGTRAEITLFELRPGESF